MKSPSIRDSTWWGSTSVLNSFCWIRYWIKNSALALISTSSSTYANKSAQFNNKFFYICHCHYDLTFNFLEGLLSVNLFALIPDAQVILKYICDIWLIDESGYLCLCLRNCNLTAFSCLKWNSRFNWSWLKSKAKV